MGAPIRLYCSLLYSFACGPYPTWLIQVAAAAAKAAAESIDNANLAARAAQDAKVSKAVRKVQAKHDGEGKRRNGSFPPPPLPPNDASFQRDEAPSTGGDASQGQAAETVPKQRHDSRTAVTKQANKTAPSAKRKTSGGERALVDDQEDFGTGDDNEAKTRAQIAALGGLTGLTEQQLGEIMWTDHMCRYAQIVFIVPCNSVRHGGHPRSRGDGHHGARW